MIDKVYEQLKTPKTLSEVHGRFNEIGIQWNLLQVKLFLEMDKKIIVKDGLYSTGEGRLEQKVLDVLDQLFKEKPKIPVKKIMEQIPFTIGKAELLHIIEGSENYYTPNGVIICKK
ncbi:hypothetical protein [Clostridium kluyveri]|uniref:hypothetical protein n=1 Tax=Clostridium kluyveri TaxID=1534 RepID=UPI002247CA4F|nr:hypothetical protein [Clostridium kluyveri]UZQ52414.1 hypothetical protein OP486_09730 [Clostridium kluyveri]